MSVETMTHVEGNSVNTGEPPKSSAHPFTFVDALSDILSSAQARYTVDNRKSYDSFVEACKDFPGGNTRTVLHASPFPLCFLAGNGCELLSLDGDTYIDFLGEFTAGIYGHSNEKIAVAVANAMSRGWNYGGPNVWERELARKVTTRFGPSGVELVRFTNSGTEANTMALAAAVAYTKRKTILVFHNGYHGGTLSFPSPAKTLSTNLPHQFAYAPYNDIEGTKAVLEGLRENELAAILVEPIQGSGGCIVGSQDFLQFLNKSAHDVDALFIVDEVMTSRLAYNGLSSTLGLKPDLVTMGKWIGGGMTFGAFGGRRDGGVMSMFDPRQNLLGHSGTFNNNIVTMAAGCTGMEIYDEAAVERLNKMGNKLRLDIQRVLSKHQPSALLTKEEDLKADTLKLWITGQGSMMNIHVSGLGSKEVQAIFWHHMLQNGIYMAQRGFIVLNIELKDHHLDKFVQVVESFMEKYGPASNSAKEIEALAKLH